jgi:hypothetical protein
MMLHSDVESGEGNRNFRLSSLLTLKGNGYHNDDIGHALLFINRYSLYRDMCPLNIVKLKANSILIFVCN